MKLVKKYYITLIIIFYSFYSLLLIFRSSFTINGVRHFVLFDDEMISMRYANNLAHGFGFVWNAGAEKVEGFTNLLWMLYMAFFHLFSIPQEKISLIIQISGIIFLAINLVFIKKITEFITGKSLLPIILSVIFTAFYFPLNNWSVVLGTEVSILTLITSIAVFIAIKCLKQKKFSFLLYLVLGLGTLIRTDMVIPSITIISFLLLVDKKNRIKNLFFGLPLFFFFIALQTIFRIWYYKETLPNTYYLKLTGFPAYLRVTRGIYVLFNFINSAIFLIPLLLLKFKRNKYILLLFTVFASQVTYSVYVGGDVWEYFGGSNRYISIVMPLFFVLFSTALFNIYLFLNQKLQKTPVLKIAIAIFILFSFINFNAPNFNMFTEFTLLKQPQTVGGNKINTQRAYIINEVTDKNAKIAMIWAGTTPYFSNRYFVDLYGKNDKIIAREKMKTYPTPKTEIQTLISFIPGHMKWDYKYSLEQLKPDLVMQVYPIEDAKPYLDKYYKKVRTNGFSEDFYVLKNSKHVDWKKLIEI